VERAIRLLGDGGLPRGGARERQLRSLLAPSLMATEGWSSDAAKANDHALRACAQDEKALGLPDLWARFSWGVVGNDLRVAESALAEIDRHPESPEQRFLCRTGRGYIAFYDGNFRQAEAAFEDALALLDQDRVSAQALDACGHEVITVARHQLLWLYALRGQVERALVKQRESERTVQAGPILRQLNVWAYGISLGLSLGRTPQAQELLERCAGALLPEAEARGLALYAAMARMGAGRALVLAGELAPGLVLMEQGHDAFLGAGVTAAGQLVYTAAFADGCLEAGELAKAASCLDHAFAHGQGRLGAYYVPELCRIRAQLHAAMGQREEARAALDAAEHAIENLARRDRPAPGAQLLQARVAATRLLLRS
jgi:tetratricopeptide (TPR) repeat protein